MHAFVSLWYSIPVPYAALSCYVSVRIRFCTSFPFSNVQSRIRSSCSSRPSSSSRSIVNTSRDATLSPGNAVWNNYSTETSNASQILTIFQVDKEDSLSSLLSVFPSFCLTVYLHVCVSVSHSLTPVAVCDINQLICLPEPERTLSSIYVIGIRGNIFVSISSLHCCGALRCFVTVNETSLGRRRRREIS